MRYAGRMHEHDVVGAADAAGDLGGPEAGIVAAEGLEAVEEAADGAVTCRRCERFPCACGELLGAFGLHPDAEALAEALLEPEETVAGGAEVSELAAEGFTESPPALDSVAFDAEGPSNVGGPSTNQPAAGAEVPSVVAELADPPHVMPQSAQDAPAGTPPDVGVGLVVASPEGLLRQSVATAVRLRKHATPANTAETYMTHWNGFVAWCTRAGLTQPMPAEPKAVEAYLAWYGADAPRPDRADGRKGHSPSSVQGALAAIIWKHRQEGFNFDATQEMRAVVRGHRNESTVRTTRRFPIRAADLTRLLLACKHEWQEALLKTGWWTALREESLVRLRVSDLRFGVYRDEKKRDVVEGGILVTKVDVVETEYVEICERESKTDKTGDGRWFVVWAAGKPEGKQWDKRDFCLVKGLRSYLENEKLSGEDWLFPARGALLGSGGHLHKKSVAKLLKDIARRAKYSPKEVALFGGHSMRRGWGTTALEEGASVAKIRQHFNHKNESTTLLYLDQADKKEFNATRGM